MGEGLAPESAGVVAGVAAAVGSAVGTGGRAGVGMPGTSEAEADGGGGGERGGGGGGLARVGVPTGVAEGTARVTAGVTEGLPVEVTGVPVGDAPGAACQMLL